jgi:hypothetical protein
MPSITDGIGQPIDQAGPPLLLQLLLLLMPLPVIDKHSRANAMHTPMKTQC